MKFFLTLACCLLSFISQAQNEFEPIDMAAIKKSVSDSTKDSFYTRLIERFNAFDTTLTKEDFKLIYFGFAFQKYYNGYEDSKQGDINKAINKNDYQEAIKICDSVLKKTPISLIANFKKGYALFKLNEKDELYFKYRSRYLNLRDAILDSGNGLKCNTAFKVLFVSDEYQVIYNYFEIEKFSTQSLEGMCDHFAITPSKYFEAANIYFDTSESLLQLDKMFNKK